jgi:ABC-type branched-subunit amino acid transport system ATPase component
MRGSRVLLLDEPTSGVTPAMIPRILEFVESLARDTGLTVIIIEHNLNVVREVGDWVYLMAGGSVEAFGVPDEVLRQEALVRIFPTW